MLPLKKHQRLKVYKRALETFKKESKNLNPADWCNGMCGHIDAAISYLRLDRHHYRGRSIDRKYFPEYHSFKPKTGWKENAAFWYSRRVSTGVPKRIEILTALAEGKTKETC